MNRRLTILIIAGFLLAALTWQSPGAYAQGESPIKATLTLRLLQLPSGLFIAATNNCSAMTFGHLRNSYIQAEKGSALFVQKNNNISLKSGQFFVGAGDVPLHFLAPGLNVALPPKGLALITVKRNKETRITLLDSGKSASVLVTVAHQPRG